MTEAFTEEIKRLEPFELKNPRPVFAQRNVLVRQVLVLGKNHQLLKLTLESEEGETICGIQFGSEAYIAKQAERLPGKRISFTFFPEVNEFRNRKTMQLRILDVISVSEDPSGS